MSDTELVLPALKPSDWIGSDKTICQLLIPSQDLPGMPWLAFGYDRPYTFEFIAKSNPEQKTSLSQIKLMEQAALRNLRARPASWEAETLTLDHRDSLQILVCANDFLAAERIIDAAFMEQAHQQLKAKRLAIGIPYRGILLATNADQSDTKIKQFAALIAAQYHQGQSAPITPLSFILEQGKIIGLIQGMEETGNVTSEANIQNDSEPYISILIVQNDNTGLEGIHILAGGDDLDLLRQRIIGAFVQVIQHLPERDQFGGEIKVIIIPDLTPQMKSLDDALAHLESHLQGISAEIPLDLPQDTPLNISIQYGHEGIDDILPLLPTPDGKESAELAALLEKLRYGESDVQIQIIRQIRNFKAPQVIEGLISTLFSVDIEVRAEAAQALVHIGPLAVEPLIAQAQSPFPYFRYGIIWALSQIATPETTDTLLDASYDQEAIIREAAITGLGNIKNPNTFETVLSALLDENNQVQAAAASALTAFQNRQVIALLKHLEPPPETAKTVRKAIQTALENLPDIPEQSAQQISEIEQWVIAERERRASAIFRKALALAEGSKWWLQELSEKTSPQFHPEILDAVKRLESEQDQISTALRITEHFTEPVLGQAVQLAIDMSGVYAEHEKQGIWAPQYLIKSIPETLAYQLQETVVNEAIALAHKITSKGPNEYKWARATVLLGYTDDKRLPSDLTERLFRAALEAARDIDEASRKASELISFVKYVPDKPIKLQLIEEALTTVLTIESDNNRTNKLNWLATSLPYNLKQETLDLARALDDVGSRAQTLGSLARYFPEPLKSETLQEALDLTHKIEKRLDRMDTLSRLIEYLPPEKQIEATKAARQIADPEDRAITMGGMARRLPQNIQIPLMREALDTAWKMKDRKVRGNTVGVLISDLLYVLKADADTLLKGKKGVQIREDAWKGLGWSWRDLMLKGTLLNLLRSVGPHIKNPVGLASILSVVALVHPQSQGRAIIQEAAAAARKADKPWQRARIIAALGWYVPEQNRAKLWAEARQIVQQIENIRLCLDLKRELLGDYTEVALGAINLLEAEPPNPQGFILVDVILGIVEQMPKKQQNAALEQAIAAANLTEGDWHKARVFNGLAEHFPDQLKPHAFQVAQQVKDDIRRVEVLRTLAGDLPVKNRKDVLDAALRETLALSDTKIRIPHLGRLLEHLPDKQKMEQTDVALTEIENLPSGWDQARVIGQIIEYLPEIFHTRAIEIIQQIEEESPRSDGLIQTAKYLSSNLYPQMLDIGLQLKNKSFQIKVLSEIANYLSDPLQNTAFAAALESANSIKDKLRQTNAFCEMVEKLPLDLKREVTGKALTLIQTIEDIPKQIKLLETLTKHAPGEFQSEILSELEGAKAQSQN